MYTETELSIFYGEKIRVGLIFDANSFKDFVNYNITAVNRSIMYFKRSKGKMHKDTLMNEIAPSMEIILNGVCISGIDESLKLNKEEIKVIKKFFPRVRKLIQKLSASDPDFASMSSTVRAMPDDKVMKYIKNLH